MQVTEQLGEAELAGFAKERKFEETVASVSVLCGVPVETADRLMAGDRPDPILILCKAANFGWITAKAIIMSRPTAKAPSNQPMDSAFANFDRLSGLPGHPAGRFC